MIDWGFVVGAFVPLVLFWMCVSPFIPSEGCILTSKMYSFGSNHLRAVWRLSLGLGFVPAVLVFLWRLKMVEPTRFRRDSMNRAKIPYLLIIRRYWASLLAICFTWCASIVFRCCDQLLIILPRGILKVPL